MQIDGIVNGKIHVDKNLVVSPSGRISGDTYAQKIIVNGIVEGSLYADAVEILSQGKVTGTIYSDDLSIERGGKFNGDTHPALKDEIVDAAKKVNSDVDTAKDKKKNNTNHSK